MSDSKINDFDEFDALVYLRVFEGCNLYCKHCFIPSNPKKMDFNKLKIGIRQLKEKIKQGDKILFQWHGGEPTIMGVDFIREAIKIIKSELPNNKIINTIQTNLINYDENWKQLYQDEFNSKIGISWDYAIRQMKKNSASSNTQYESLFWKNVAKLQSDGIKFNLIITVTKLFQDKFKNPFNFFNFIEEKNIIDVHFERLTKTGYARENWHDIGVNNKEYSEFMSRYSKAYLTYSRKDHSHHFNFSPFDGLFKSVLKLKSDKKSTGYGCHSTFCDNHFHTIDSNGYKAGCTAINSETDNKVIKSKNIIKIYNINESRRLRTENCSMCKYKPICSSGCLANEYNDNSMECSGSYGLFSTINKIL